MINRVLIRIKVVQMFYSYLLNRCDFSIFPAPDVPSRDRKCAYNVYLDVLALVARMSGFSVGGLGGERGADNRHLSANRVGRGLMGESDLRAAFEKRHPLNGLSRNDFEALMSAVTNCAAYRSYVRLKDKTIKEDVALWRTVIESVIATSEVFMEMCRHDEDFTIKGMEDGVRMALETLAAYGDDRLLLLNSRKSLERSLDKAYELYHLLLLLPCEITHMEDLRLDAARNKFLPTSSDLNPDTRFIDNRFVKAVAGNPAMTEYLERNPVSWADDDVLVKHLLDKIKGSQLYAGYMQGGEPTFADDCQFWRAVMKNIVLPDEDLAEALEAKSVFWNDDLDIMGTFVLKTIRRIGADPENAEKALLPKYKDEEDEDFGPTLFRTAVEHRVEYRELIDRFVRNDQWDAGRLALMDVVVMTVAIAEIMTFPAIPLAVSLNEYIEMANAYSTSKSGQFINGILYSVVNALKNEGKLVKS